ncbi:MAG: lipase maturation factor family protein [Candidatus Latescibacterota bacterium]|nr:lipase maturation factor family protein [Candidatus Latescibacterota bacterium]
MVIDTVLPSAAQAAWTTLRRRLDPPELDYRLTRWLFLRLLGLIYSCAFYVLLFQLEPLIGRNGLLPVRLYLDRFGASGGGFFELPSLMWLHSGDGFMLALATFGLGLSLLLLVGYATGAHLLALWFLYTSFVNVGQLFYGYGWEILLLETGFLAVFLCPFVGDGWRHRSLAPERTVLWLLRWLLFRVMFGAGLIKIRGDACWTDLTCLLYHYESQPIPNPISPLLHHMPAWFHAAGVLFNHLVELVAPFLLFATPRVRWVGAGLIAVFQMILIVSGNLAFLNHLTIAVCVAGFDDRLWVQVLPARFVSWVRTPNASVGPPVPKAPRRWAAAVLLLVVAYLSINPVTNLLSSRQAMNTSFDRLHLVNTYGAFGSVGKVRNEVILLGTTDPKPGPHSEWKEYEFNCKPGDPTRRPCWMSPYHYRVDWQIWFAAMTDYRTQPWIVHFAYKLLVADPGALGLLARDPFNGERPTALRADLYRYRFAPVGDTAWWLRERIGEYLPLLQADSPGLRRVVESFGWPLYTEDGTSAVATPPCPCVSDV